MDRFENIKVHSNPTYGYPIILHYSYIVNTKGAFWQKRRIFVVESDKKEATAFVECDKAAQGGFWADPSRSRGKTDVKNSTKKVKLGGKIFKNTAEIYENDRE